MRIIPAIDIIDGKCVRLKQGDYDQKTIYNDNPVAVARIFEDAGMRYLHLVDLDGAKAGQTVNYKLLEKICSLTKLRVDFGGGIKSMNDISIAFESGATQVTCGSIAVSDPEQFHDWIKRYGSEKIILGADFRDGNIAVNAWKDISDESLTGFIGSYLDKGVEYVISTDVSKDGMMKGPAFDVYQEMLGLNDFNLIASGGIRNREDILRLKDIGCEGAIIGKAIYEGDLSLKEIRDLC